MAGMENWLLCNKCYRSMKTSKKTFSLTQCQHVFCSTCVVKVEEKCPECSAIGVKTVPLIKPLPQPLLHYFGSVGSCLQQGLEAARFQRTQSLITLRRFDEIESKYEDMKRTYYQGAQQMKSFMAAYAQLKERNTKVRAELCELRSTELGRSARNESPEFTRVSMDQRAHENQRMMDYAMSGSNHSRIGVTQNDARSSACQNSSRFPIATPSVKQSNWGPSQNHVAHSAHQNWSRARVMENRLSPIAENLTPQYPPRVVSSYILPSGRDGRRLDSRWTARNRITDSLGEASNFSSFGGTSNDSPTVIDNYSDYERS